jgi:signal peptidase I
MSGGILAGAGVWVLGAVIAAVALTGAWVAWLRHRFLTVTVRGSSMEPTLRAGDRVLVRRRPLAAVRCGDLVVFEDVPDPRRLSEQERRLGSGLLPDKQRIRMVKRVVAIPGDPVPASVLPALAADRSAVPSGSLVVLGDNAAASTDSRTFGYITADRLLGVVLRKL